MKAVPVFAVVGINKYIFKLPFYKHHYFALILILFGALSLLIIHYIISPVNNDYIESIFIYCAFAFQKIVGGAREVIDLYIMQDNNVSPFILLFYQGLSGFIFCVACAFIFNFVPCLQFWNMQYCDATSKIEDFRSFFVQIGSF